jgi:hypothetical protein
MRGTFEIDVSNCSICNSFAEQWPVLNCTERTYKSNAYCSNKLCKNYIVNLTNQAWNTIQLDEKTRRITMTNELGTTLQDIEAKAERKREALFCLGFFKAGGFKHPSLADKFETIRKYIEEN